MRRGTGHKRKTWKRRWCVVWPKKFEEHDLIAPILFYFEREDVRTRAAQLRTARPRVVLTCLCPVLSVS